MLFRDKVALVTGGATGIGRSTALRFAEEGAKVAVVDINVTEAVNTIDMIKAAGGQAMFVRADMTSSADIAAMVSEVTSKWGRLDAAFNNAGTPGYFTNAVDCSEEEFDAVVSLNLKSVWLCMKHEIPAMLASGGGAIVNTASRAAVNPSPHMASYIGTKAGVIGLTRSAAFDFAPQGIRVNTLLPGPIVTPMFLRGSKGLARDEQGMLEFVPMRRVGQPHETGDAVIWLCSSQASFVTGLSVSVDGGLNLV